MVLRMGKPAALVIWVPVCFTAFFVCQTALQAASRTVYAFSRDKGLPDRGFFGYISTWSQTPVRSVWIVVFISVLPGLLDLASPIALNAVFAMTAMALDLSYIIPILWYVSFLPLLIGVLSSMNVLAAAGGTGTIPRSSSCQGRSTWGTASSDGPRT